MAHRFFVSPESIHGRTVHFSPTQTHQLRNVLRLGAWDEIVVLDNTGVEYRVRLSPFTRDPIRGEIIAQHLSAGEPRTRLVLYQALLKADKFEWVLQKGTELGVAAFVPVVTERSVRDVGKNKFARWTQIVTEAAEQSGRGKLPVLASHQTMQTALASAQAEGGLILLPWEAETANDLATALRDPPLPTVHLFIGPEGGLSEREVELARAHHAEIISLGPRILRAETAGLVAAGAIFFARGDLSRA
ncbi:MAG: 16S rRNA (uracil(1498)-N(3))-methyltransferase [Anaerolineae bacterium]|nr:16S rRNA (uracil(1498)-N(3))-methyltransferase [Anaerolineae bacterium]